MKYKEIIRDIAAAGLIAFSFWSVFYPEFTFMEKLMPEKADEAVKQTQAQKETSAAAVNGKMSAAKAVR